MRFPLLCVLILTFSLNVVAAEQHTPTVPPFLTAPPQQSTPSNTKPQWLLLPVKPATESQQATPRLNKKEPAARIAAPPVGNEKQKTDPTSEPQTLHKKTTPSGTHKKVRADFKNVGKGNAVPLMLAAAVYEIDPAQQAPFSWAEILTGHKNGRQVTATPPLRAGIRQQHLWIDPEPQLTFESILTKALRQQEEGAERTSDTLGMLTSLVELQKNIKQQAAVTTKKLKISTSESEKQALQSELTKLDKQLGETGVDFERIATGVESEVFSEQQKVAFSWKDELATLLEPSIKELKQLTRRARLKSELKETISRYSNQQTTAGRAVEHLNQLISEAKDPKIKAYLSELLPAWQNAEKRISSKLDLTQRELAKLEEKEVSLFESSSNSMREFFRNRGLYLLIAFFVFIAILVAFRLFARLVFFLLPGAQKEQRPIHVRVLDIFFRIFSIFSAIFALVFVLYTAEDWFLLSATIIFFLALAWTVRQALPKMWQQVRLVLNMGSLREGERVIYEGVPWKVESINVFCKLSNPALAMHLRIPIENMIGLISRPYNNDEPWFPCKKGDWVSLEGKPFAKVVSLSHELVELVELGGRRTVYQTGNFLDLSPANLSSNFNLKVSFGLSYNLQADITTTVPEILQAFLQKKMEESGYAKDCLSLSVDFYQAGASSLDLVVLADFKGDKAPVYRRIERALTKWCVECCNANNWEIPFPQMTVHLPPGGAAEPEHKKSC